MQNGLQVYEMRTSSPVKRESLWDKFVGKVIDGTMLVLLAGGLLVIGGVYGYLLAMM